MIPEKIRKKGSTPVMASSGRALVSLDGAFLQADPYLGQLLGMSDRQVSKCRFHDITHPDDLARDVAQVERLLSNGQGSYSLLKRYMHSKGDEIWIELNVQLRQGGFCDNCPFEVSIRQASVSAQALQDVHDKAFRDPLTGSPNRHALDEQLIAAEARARRTGYPFAFVMLDLDGFKLINDTRGHQVGDALLGAVSQRLHSALEPGDFAARMGGDEFGLLMFDIRHEADLKLRVARLQAALQPSYTMPDGPLQLTTSMGWALYPHEASSVSELLLRADGAMYRSKRAIFSPQSRRAPLSSRG